MSLEVIRSVTDSGAVTTVAEGFPTRAAHTYTSDNVLVCYLL